MGYKVVESVVVSLLVLLQLLKILLNNPNLILISVHWPPLLQTSSSPAQPPTWTTRLACLHFLCKFLVHKKSVINVFKNENTLNSHFPSSAPLSFSLSLGLQKGEPLLAELKSYLLLFWNLFNKGDGLGKTWGSLLLCGSISIFKVAI